MSNHIRQLDSALSNNLRASLRFPDLTSIILKLLQTVLSLHPATLVDVQVRLAPDWQIVCTFDGGGVECSEPFEGLFDDHLHLLAHIGVLHVQSRGHRWSRKGESDQTGRGKMLLQSGDKNLVALCDVFTDVPVRRNALISHAAARAELHRCRRIVAAMTLLAPHVAFSFGAYMHYETEQQILLQCDKALSSEQRYESAFGLPVSVAAFALPVSARVGLRTSELKLSGFVIHQTLASRSFQHIFVNDMPIMQDTACLFGKESGLHGVTNESVYNVLHSKVQNFIKVHILHDSVPAGTATRHSLHCGYMLRIKWQGSDAEETSNGQEMRKALSAALMQSIGQIVQARPGSTTVHPLQTANRMPYTPTAMIDYARSTHFSALDRSKLRQDPSSQESSMKPNWLNDILQSAYLSRAETKQRKMDDSEGDANDLEEESIIEKDVRLTRETLRGSTVIGQADVKYVACLLRNQNLVLFDQHAAHERVLLEKTLLGYLDSCLQENPEPSRFGEDVNVRTKQPVPLGIAWLPASLACCLQDEEARRLLLFWQFDIRCRPCPLPNGGATDSGVEAQLCSAPSQLQRRLREDDDSVPKLVEALAAWLEEGAAYRYADIRCTLRESQSEDTRWMAVARHLPVHVISLFASTACRSAIMFNDRLTVAQCEHLISQLRQTTFPFQCAHGRPSMATLGDLRDAQRTDNASDPIQWSRLACLSPRE